MPCPREAIAPVAAPSSRGPALRAVLDKLDRGDLAGARAAAQKVDAVTEHIVSWMTATTAGPWQLKSSEIAATIDKAKSSGATALNVLASPMLDGNVPLIMKRVAALRLPAIYQWAYWAEAGGFIGYGPSLDQLEDLTARFAASLLRGTIPADLPVEQPTKFELVINLKTAKAMGVTVPEALLARADRVME